MMAAKAWALSAIWSRYWRRKASGTSTSLAIRARPSMPLSGVRSSWLVLARKALLARLAASASSRARASASSNWRRSVTSSTIQTVPLSAGRVGSMARPRARTRKLLPSLRRAGRSTSMASPRASGGPTMRPSSA